MVQKLTKQEVFLPMVKCPWNPPLFNTFNSFFTFNQLTYYRKIYLLDLTADNLIVRFIDKIIKLSESENY